MGEESEDTPARPPPVAQAHVVASALPSPPLTSPPRSANDLADAPVEPQKHHRELWQPQQAPALQLASPSGLAPPLRPITAAVAAAAAIEKQVELQTLKP
jgi:hypothetical protein